MTITEEQNTNINPTNSSKVTANTQLSSPHAKKVYTKPTLEVLNSKRIERKLATSTIEGTLPGSSIGPS